MAAGANLLRTWCRATRRQSVCALVRFQDRAVGSWRGGCCCCLRELVELPSCQLPARNRARGRQEQLLV